MAMDRRFNKSLFTAMLLAPALACADSSGTGGTSDAANKSNNPLNLAPGFNLQDYYTPDTEQRVDLLGPVLRDPILAVRIASAHALLGAGPQLGGYQAAFEQAIGEYEQVQLSLQERAEANLNLALLYQATGRTDQVEHYLRTALQRDGDFLPALVTLVQWLDARQRQAEADALLAARLKAQPQVALLQFTQGLALVRRGQAQAALAALREANRLEPDNARYAYVLALSLQDQGDAEGARSLLQSALDRHPENRDVRLALVAQLRDDGQVAQMKTLIDQLKAINPGDPVLH